ncbi:hypothetical protein PanWU01x14_094880 [Parasponia andersonii]|uniref:Uncharacterized protein n=1 Tax=Parasponia andersonii TaxID=3476 RepID=A0A2P5D5F4_PARAD|nr:hypothetical protein PanWU01x14_094880 [Parasponia andersonii]
MLHFKILLIQEIDVVRRRFQMSTLYVDCMVFFSQYSFVRCKRSNGISKFLSAFHYYTALFFPPFFSFLIYKDVCIHQFRFLSCELNQCGFSGFDTNFLIPLLW